MLKLLLLSLVMQNVAEEVDDLELVLVQAMWNHGDISPTRIYKNDPFKEANWTFGGGGFGQLSPLGMKQQLQLGKLLKEKYVDTKFLSPSYTSDEIYIRSTDTDRTISSAMCNILGMYGQRDKTNVQYPNKKDWPRGLVPVPVHTVSKFHDHVAVPDAPCRRRMTLWKLALQSKQIRDYVNTDIVSGYLKYLSKKCGEEIRIDNFHEIRDILRIEQIYYGHIIRDEVPWFFESLYYLVNEIANQTQLYLNGVFNGSVMVSGLDVGHEIKKVRGGAFINELNARMELKLECIENYEKAKCSWIKPLKYYAYSVHDSTMFQFFAILGAERRISNRVYPKYAAAATLELYVSKSDKRNYFRMLYRPDAESAFSPVTRKIKGCKGKEYCSLEVFKEYAEKFNPNMTMEEFCKTKVFQYSSTSSTRSTKKSSRSSLHRSLSVLLLLFVYFM